MMECLNLEMRLTKNNVQVIIIELGLYKTGFNQYGFDKKYEFMNNDFFFKEQVKTIRKSENLILKLFEKKKLDSACKQIIKAIKDEKPKLVYHSPFSHVLFAKLYNFFLKK